jgi:diacylglycerol O-acyltransferase
VQQLSGLDTTFLNIETPTTYGHTSGLAIFDPSTADHLTSFEEVRRILTERLHLVPPFRRRLVEVPFGLDQPYWIEDPDFDIDFHVRNIGLPRPGTMRQLAEQVERIIARPLDRRRPLWELYFIEGLENGCVAQLTKVHHCALDGVGGAEALAATLDLTPEPRAVEPPAHPWEPDRIPTDLEMLDRGLFSLSLQPLKDLHLFLETMNNLPELARAAGIEFPVLGQRRVASLDIAAPMLSKAGGTPPRTIFNTIIGPHRRFAFTSIDLGDIKTVKDAFGATVNDVVLAMSAGALRRYLVEHDDLPEDPLVAMVPISVRAQQQSGEVGNQVASMTTSLHTDIEDPAARLRAIHESMKIAKDQHRAVPAELQQDLAQFSPPLVAAQAARLGVRAAADGWVDLPYNVVISNVPGPQFPLYRVGAELLASYPVSTITDGSGLNITVQSYNGRLDVGVVGCRELVPDIWDIVDHLHECVEELLEAVTSDEASPAPSKKRAARKQPAKKNAAAKRPARKKAAAKQPAKKRAAAKGAG